MSAAPVRRAFLQAPLLTLDDLQVRREQIVQCRSAVEQPADAVEAGVQLASYSRWPAAVGRVGAMMPVSE